MEYRPLGRTDLYVSIIGFGASPLGAEFGTIDPADGKRAVDYAIDQGINYFDVAPYYGRTLAETRLGHFLRGKRDRIILATKVGRYGVALPDGFDYTAQRVVRSVEESLHRLQTDVIDVIQVHDVEFGERDRIVHETLPALQTLREDGKVRFIGVTGYPLGILKQIATGYPVDTVLSYCRYNLLNTTLDDILTPLAVSKGLGLINASPLLMRALTDAGAPSWHPAPQPVLDAAEKAAQWCAARGLDLADIAMRFALAHPHVATTLVGMGSMTQVEKNVQALNSPLDETLTAAIRTLLKPVLNVNWIEGRAENNDPGSVPKRLIQPQRT